MGIPAFDCYGHCVLCHKNMVIEQSIDGKALKRFTPEYAETEYLLDDGSRMRVAICNTCKNGLSELLEDDIMKCVVKGWAEEVKGFKHWDQEKKDKYMARYGKLKIVVNSENVPQDILDKKLKKYKDKKHG